jgi:hypothetical protein
MALEVMRDILRELYCARSLLRARACPGGGQDTDVACVPPTPKFRDVTMSTKLAIPKVLLGVGGHLLGGRARKYASE